MNSYSEPPIISAGPTSRGPVERVTFAEVAMRLVTDGPIYAIIVLVGAMAVGGHATASEAVITGLAGLLARSWPRAVQVAGKVGVVVLASSLAFGATYACEPARPVAYGAELALCTAAADARLDAGGITKREACDDSIRCENEVRARYPKNGGPRPLRDIDAGCN
jgi:hypothetical protein